MLPPIIVGGKLNDDTVDQVAVIMDEQITGLEQKLKELSASED